VVRKQYGEVDQFPDRERNSDGGNDHQNDDQFAKAIEHTSVHGHGSFTPAIRDGSGLLDAALEPGANGTAILPCADDTPSP
jgi:hypothetical protein